MRQWELVGITDREWIPPKDPPATPIAAERVRAADELGDLPEVLWSTDAALRVTSATTVAAVMLGSPVPLEGRNLLEVFGLEGAGAGVVAAHVEALCGRQAAFTVDLDDSTIRCRAVPLRGDEDTVAGTICVGIHEIARPDLTVVDDTEPIRVA
ncbi:MAG: hypothetical protein U0V56_02760 [Actinomycetota bacterium]